MRVLIVAPRFPFPPRWGYATRVLHLGRQLAARHDVIMLTYAPDDPRYLARLREEFPVEVVRRAAPSICLKRTKQLLSIASPLPFDSRATYSRQMQNALDDVCARENVDVIHLEGNAISAFRFPPDIPLVLDEHNIDYETFERLRRHERSPIRRVFYRAEEVRFRQAEQRLWREVAGCILCSEREQEIVRRAAPATATIVAPNSVDIDYFKPADTDVEPGTIVFNGTLDYRPNLDAATFLVTQVLPTVRRRHSGVRATLIGRGAQSVLEKLRRPGVQVVGEVPDIRPYVRSAAVVVVPIRTGGGTRLKVVEGLAMGKAMVSTRLGAEGVSARHGEHLLLADTVEAFASAIVGLFDDRDRAAALGRAGRALIEREYSWARAGQRLEELYREVMAARSGALQGPAVRVTDVVRYPQCRSLDKPRGEHSSV